MRQEDFDKLVKSIKQAGAIKKGEMASSRRAPQGLPAPHDTSLRPDAAAPPFILGAACASGFHK